MPNSLTGTHSYTLVYSTKTPVSVCGTVANKSHIEVFPASQVSKVASARELQLPIRDRMYPRQVLETPSRIYLARLTNSLEVDLSTF